MSKRTVGRVTAILAGLVKTLPHEIARGLEIIEETTERTPMGIANTRCRHAGCCATTRSVTFIELNRRRGLNCNTWGTHQSQIVRLDGEAFHRAGGRIFRPIVDYRLHCDRRVSAETRLASTTGIATV